MPSHSSTNRFRASLVTGELNDSIFRQKLLFETEMHKKYNAQVYFYHLKDQFKSLYHMQVKTQFISYCTCAKKSQFAVLQDLPGSKSSKKAYQDYLDGLEMIGQQEELKPLRHVRDDDINKMKAQEEGSDGNKQTLLEEASDSNFPLQKLCPDAKAAKENLWKAAEWEREVTMRKHAIQGAPSVPPAHTPLKQ